MEIYGIEMAEYIYFFLKIPYGIPSTWNYRVACLRNRDCLKVLKEILQTSLFSVLLSFVEQCNDQNHHTTKIKQRSKKSFMKNNINNIYFEINLMKIL